MSSVFLVYWKSQLCAICRTDDDAKAWLAISEERIAELNAMPRAMALTEGQKFSMDDYEVFELPIWESADDR